MARAEKMRMTVDRCACGPVPDLVVDPKPLLAAINETLTMGSNPTRANLAFDLLLTLMGVRRADLPRSELGEVGAIFDIIHERTPRG